ARAFDEHGLAPEHRDAMERREIGFRDRRLAELTAPAVDVREDPARFAREHRDVALEVLAGSGVEARVAHRPLGSLAPARGDLERELAAARPGGVIVAG